MPKRPKKPCAHNGCSALAQPPERYCSKHAGDAKIPDRLYDANRGTTTERGYDGRWRKVRRMYLSREPFCEVCGRQAEDVHHIKPLSEGGTHAMDNLQALCRACHNEITHRIDNNARFVLVYGPPGSGKTTYVMQQKRESEPIIDMDMIFQSISGLEPYNNPAPLLPMVLQIYEDAIQAATRYCEGRVWVVTSAATHNKRKQIMAYARPYTEIRIDTSALECMRRINNDERRAGSTLLWRPIVERWFEEHARDVLQRGEGG